RLRLTTALGHRLGEIGEQQREPEPEVDLEGKADAGGAGDQVAGEQDGGQRRNHLDSEHHRVAPHDPGVEFSKRLADGRRNDRRVEQAGGGAATGADRGVHGRCLQKTVPTSTAKCSTMGPSASAGKKVRPPTIRMTPTTRPTKSGPSVGKV